MAVEQPPAFGIQLRHHRLTAGLSQEDLAERAGLTPSAIGALERGARRRPYPHTVQVLADALGLEPIRRTAFIAAARRALPTAPARNDVDDHALGAVVDARAAPPSADGGGTAFVGREPERAALRARLAEAAAGRGGIVVVVGEAGIGKTSLARVFAGDAAAQGATVLWGCCFEGDWQPPYGPWVEAVGVYVRSRLAAAAVAPASATSLPPDDLRRTLGPGAGPLARLIPEVAELAGVAALPDVSVAGQLSADEERFRLYDAVVRLLLAAAQARPLVLVLDDLHWADADSLRLLRHLARFLGQARVLVIGAYRDPEVGLTDDHPLMATLAVLSREAGYGRIVLRGFSHDEVAAYLAHAAGQALPQALVRVIEAETDGNPFYAGEVFRHLTEEAKLLLREGRWSTDVSLGELAIPEGVRQVVGRRVAQLSSPTSTLLKLAAGFTGHFRFDVLQALGELPEQALLDCLDEALQAGLIRASRAAPPRYTFAHAIVRHTLYEGLNLDRRMRLHRRIALALRQVRQGGAAGADDAAEIATQYHASAALAGAAEGIPFALRAAEQTRAVYAHDRTAGFLRMARDLAAESPPATRAEILRQLAIAEAEAVELERAPRSVDQAVGAMRAAGVPSREQAAFLSTVARALKDGGASAAVWEPLVEQGLALVGGRRDLVWARLALLRNRFEPIRSGPIGGAQWLGSDPDAVAVARAEGDEDDYARTLEPLDCRMREETAAVLALARTWSRPGAIMRALEVAGRDLLYRHGAVREARSVYEELLAVSERFGSIPAQGEALAHLISCLVEAGELQVAQETFGRAQEVIARLGVDHRMHEFVPISRAVLFAYFLDGEWAPLAAEAVRFATSPAAWRSPVGIVAGAIAALSASRAGHVTQAGDLLRHVTAAAEQAPPTAYALNVAVAFAGSAAWDLAAAEHAAAYRRLVLALADAGVGETGLGPFELYLARMAALLDAPDVAQQHFAQARQKTDASGQPHFRAIVDYDEATALLRATCAGSTGPAGRTGRGRPGRLGRPDRTRIVGLLDAATQAFRAQGMVGWVGRAADRMAELEALETTGRSARSDRADDRREHPAGLSTREVEVLERVADGKTNKEIAAELVLSVATVERHVANIYGKIGAARRYDAVAFARSHGLAHP